MNDPINNFDANGLFLGKVGGTISIVGGAVVTIIGIGITAVAAAEAHSVILIPFIPHTVGAGTTIIGAGITTMYLGYKVWEADSDVPCK